jgi:hypothetical protein
MLGAPKLQGHFLKGNALGEKTWLTVTAKDLSGAFRAD